jgi:hypothetical protein
METSQPKEDRGKRQLQSKAVFTASFSVWNLVVNGDMFDFVVGLMRMQ